MKSHLPPKLVSGKGMHMGKSHRSLKRWHRPSQRRKSKAPCIRLSECVGFLPLGATWSRWTRWLMLQETEKEQISGDTYSIRWGSMLLAEKWSCRWTRGCARGRRAGRGCSSCRCPSLPCAARCLRSSASKSPRSQCCQTHMPFSSPFLLSNSLEIGDSQED